MAKHPAKSRSRPQAPKPEPQLVIADSWADRYWKWGGRVALIVGFVGGGLWWLFGWYNGVEGLKTTVSAVVVRVDKLQSGQDETHSLLNSIQNSIKKAAEK